MRRRGGAVPELPGEGLAQRLGRGVQRTQTGPRHRGAVQAHSHLLEPAQRGQHKPSSHFALRRCCVRSVSVEPWNASALRNAVVSSLAAGRAHPPTPAASLSPSVLFIWTDGSRCCRCGWAGEAVRSPGSLGSSAGAGKRCLNCSDPPLPPTPALHHFTVVEDLDGEMFRYGRKKLANLARGGNWDRFCGKSCAETASRGVDESILAVPDGTGILPASTSFLPPQLLYSCGSVSPENVLARHVMISHGRILPKLSHFVGIAGLALVWWETSSARV